MDKLESPDLLESMVGKIVRVFKGGPESRKGKVLAVTPDYLVLHTKEEGVIYYQSFHIKSVIENAKENTERLNEFITDVEFIDAFDFNELLERLKNKIITIDRGGPESRTGLLLNVYRDFMVLRTNEEGDLYYQIQHIKSISEKTAAIKNENGKNENGKNEKEKQKQEKRDKQENHEKQVFFVNSDLRGVQNFNSLLDNLQYRWVKVNRGGPESIEGILVDNQDETLVLVSHHDIDWISTYHIRNISLVTQENKDDSKKQNNQNKDNKNSSSESKNSKRSSSASESTNNKQSNSNSESKNNKRSNSGSKGNKKQNKKVTRSSTKFSSTKTFSKNFSQSKPVLIAN